MFREGENREEEIRAGEVANMEKAPGDCGLKDGKCDESKTFVKPIDGKGKGQVT